MAQWARRKRRVRLGSLQEFSWENMGADAMAVSGSVTAAYRCQVSEFRLETKPTTVLRGECANVEAALAILERGEACVVAGFDMAQLRQRLAGLGVG